MLFAAGLPLAQAAGTAERTANTTAATGNTARPYLTYPFVPTCDASWPANPGWTSPRRLAWTLRVWVVPPHLPTDIPRSGNISCSDGKRIRWCFARTVALVFSAVWRSYL